MPRSVLVTDDTLYARSIVKDILASRGYRIAGEARNGLEAVQRYKELRPDLVTMDVMMPEMDGIAAVKRIKEFDPNATILMCTSMGHRALLLEALTAGAAGFVTKPFREVAFISCVKRLIG